MLRLVLILAFLLATLPALPPAAPPAKEFRPPAGVRPAARRPGAESVLPGGRMVEPLGRSFQTGPGAFGVAVSPDGKLAVTANGGPDRFSLTVLDMTSDAWQVLQLRAKLRPEDKSESGRDDDDWRSVFMGLAFESDRRLFASEGNSGRVREVALPSGRLLNLLELNQGPWRDSFSGDLACDPARRLLYVVDQANFRVAIFNTRTQKLVSSVTTGRLPFRIALSPDRLHLYVTNTGMFQYSAIPGADPRHPQTTAIPFPAFGFPSKQAWEGVTVPTSAGPVAVPGLGDPNAPQSNSLSVIDVSDPANARLEALVRTGAPFGPNSMGGSGPTGVAASPAAIYVANGNQDTISVVDAVTLSVREQIPLRISGLENFRGILPVGLTLDLNNGRLLVAEAGINAVGVVNLTTNRLDAHLPAGWFPTSIALDRGRVFVANAKGLGTGPNATRMAPIERSFQGEMRTGMLTVFDMPLPHLMPMLTERVYALGGFLSRRLEPSALPAAIRHVVLIVKENRTFDEVFGATTSAANGPVNGAPDLARLGPSGWLWYEPGSLKARAGKRSYNLTPNHQALARRYAMSDNFYADSEVSVDGHHWLVGSYPNAWTESSLMAAYGGQKDFRFPTTAPGRLSNATSNSSLHPEEQLEAGALWHHLDRLGVTFRNFGEGFELAGVEEEPGEKPTGARYLVNVPMPEPLYRNTSRDYPQFNMNVPDQYRATQLIAELERLYNQPGTDLPRFIYIHLPNDHMAKPRPADGFPFAASYVADNDYALGRIMEYLTHSRWWKQMAVFVTEDDAQGGVDHVDSHRTVLLALSPYARSNYVAHTNSSFPGLLRTVFRLLGLPPLNLYDATAADLADCFTSQPDFTPYTALRPDPDVFVPEKAKDPDDPQPSVQMDSPAFLRQQHQPQ
ncbi:MAG: bifunctional YncE family protein/alkaline phosphatase family protein [Bryobacteraceae bacterium]